MVFVNLSWLWFWLVTLLITSVGSTDSWEKIKSVNEKFSSVWSHDKKGKSRTSAGLHGLDMIATVSFLFNCTSSIWTFMDLICVCNILVLSMMFLCFLFFCFCLMNSKSEFHQHPVVRVVPMRGLQHEQGEAVMEQRRGGGRGRGQAAARGQRRQGQDQWKHTFCPYFVFEPLSLFFGDQLNLDSLKSLLAW